MHVVDLFWQIRPMAYSTFDWVDITGVLGPVCIFAALVIFMIRRSPLIPIKDPRLGEALNHKNYV